MDLYDFDGFTRRRVINLAHDEQTSHLLGIDKSQKVVTMSGDIFVLFGILLLPFASILLPGCDAFHKPNAVDPFTAEL